LVVFFVFIEIKANKKERAIKPVQIIGGKNV
jgi:hypothetical protein